MIVSQRSWSSRAVPYIMLAPFLVLFFGFFIYPLLYAFRLSLYSGRTGRGTFVGFANYITAFKDGIFLVFDPHRGPIWRHATSDHADSCPCPCAVA